MLSLASTSTGRSLRAFSRLGHSLATRRTQLATRLEPSPSLGLDAADLITLDKVNSEFDACRSLSTLVPVQNTVRARCAFVQRPYPDPLSPMWSPAHGSLDATSIPRLHSKQESSLTPLHRHRTMSSSAAESSTPIDAPAAPAAGLASILKQQSAYYDPSSPADAQFFPSEPSHAADSLPPPTEQDPEAAGAEDDYDDPDGALWSGPAARSVPTSVSGFRLRARSRSEIDRRSRELARERDAQSDANNGDDSDDARSRKSRRRSRRRRSGSSKRTARSRRGSDASAVTTDGEGLTTDAESVRSRSRSTRRTARRDSSSGSDSDNERVGFFEGISNALRGRRASAARDGRPDVTASPARSRAGSIRSRRSSRSRSRAQTPGYESDAVSARSGDSGDDEDPYGPYGSDDDSLSTSSSTQSSSSSLDESGGPRRRRNNAGVLGLPGAGAGDFFGESRIDFGGSDEGDDDEMSELSEDDDELKKGGKPSHQLVYIPDEDLPLRFVGLHLSQARVVAWWVACVLSGGTLWLLGRWMPNLWRNSTGRMGEFDKASYVVVEVRAPVPLSSSACDRC